MTGPIRMTELCWPVDRAGEALDALSFESGVVTRRTQAAIPPAPVQGTEPQELDRWMDWAARRMGFEVEAVATPLAGFTGRMGACAPALFHIPADANQPGGLLLIVKSGKKYLHVLTPEMKTRKILSGDLLDTLSAPFTSPLKAATDHLLDVAAVSPGKRETTRQALLTEHLADQPLGQCWLLRASPDAGFWTQVSLARLPAKVMWMMVAFLVLYLAEMLGWGLIGKITLNGQLDTGWLIAWSLLVLSLVPLHLLGNWLDATFALDFGRLLKTRLLSGILGSSIDTIRRQGAGQLLSRVMESQALESLALNGGIGVLVALLECLLAATVLLQGAGGALHVGLLLGWLGLALLWSYRYFQRLRNWTLMRLDMTHTLVENMVGHRTRLAQERLSRRDEAEDRSIRDYLEASKAMDEALIPAQAWMPRGWMLVGVLGLTPAFVSGDNSAASLAIALGGILLANRALSGISGGLAALSRAGVAWSQVNSLFLSVKPDLSQEPFLPTRPAPDADAEGRPGIDAPVLQAHQLSFRYAPHSPVVLNNVALTIRRGEKILLEGASGGGKSTLASILVGLRRPDTGLLLLNGLDRQTLGNAWHQMVTQAPQFHENHILSGPLAFNLLMGRNWPASPEDIQEAQDICLELGLGDLLERMPAGIMQMVGETGWQLSHGERSRVFLARALLQKTQLTVLDESFAALDPETLKLCMDCALKRSMTTLVIAHP